MASTDAQCLAFRRLVCNFSQQLSREERQRIAYIRLYECREQYRYASSLDVLSKLEMCGVFSLSNPAGLIEVAKDINRSDLVNLVKDFMKNQRSKSKEKKSKRKSANKVEKTNELCDEEMTRLGPAVEMTLSQTSALALLVDRLQRAIVLRERQKATEASQEAGRAVKELSEQLGKVREALESHINPRNSTSSSSSDEGTCKQPVQETCGDPVQTLANVLHTPRPHKDKQRGMLMADCQIKPTRWTKPTEYHSNGCSQSAPCSPYLGRDSTNSGRHTPECVTKTAVSLQKTPKKPMIPPTMRHLPPKTPTKTPVKDYVTLSPDIDDDAPTTSGTGDSGYGGAEEWKQHMHYPPPLKATVTVSPGFPPTKNLGSEEHYYKSLHKDTIKDDVYEKLQQ